MFQLREPWKAMRIGSTYGICTDSDIPTYMATVSCAGTDAERQRVAEHICTLHNIELKRDKARLEAVKALRTAATPDAVKEALREKGLLEFHEECARLGVPPG